MNLPASTLITGLKQPIKIVCGVLRGGVGTDVASCQAFSDCQQIHRNLRGQKQLSPRLQGLQGGRTTLYCYEPADPRAGQDEHLGRSASGNSDT